MNNKKSKTKAKSSLIQLNKWNSEFREKRMHAQFTANSQIVNQSMRQFGLMTESSSFLPSRKVTPRKLDKDQFWMCKVCNDKATGIHYGISSCEGCKGFYKRSILRQRSYTCAMHGQCDVTVEKRKNCKACRFAKCLRVGMCLEGIKMGRLSKNEKYKLLKSNGETPNFSSDETKISFKFWVLRSNNWKKLFNLIFLIFDQQGGPLCPVVRKKKFYFFFKSRDHMYTRCGFFFQKKIEIKIVLKLNKKFYLIFWFLTNRGDP